MLVLNAFTHDSRVEREARTLQEAGYDVTVVAMASGNLPLEEVRDGYDVLRVRRTRVLTIGLRFADQRRRLLRALDTTRPDILQAHDTDALEPVATLATRRGIPFVYDGHELWLGRGSRGRSRPYHLLGQAYYRWIERRYLPRAAATIVANPPVGPALATTYGIPQPLSVPNYPDRSEIGPRQELRSLPGGESLRDDLPVVLYLGGLMPDRGIEALVEAMTSVEAQLVFLGSGPLERALRDIVNARAIDDRTTFLDPVAPADVVAYASSADIGVSVLPPTSRNNRYSLPNKLLQCMAAGLAIVASDYPQIREIVATSGSGILVDTSDARGIKIGLERLVADPQLRATMGAAARRAVADTFNWETSAQVLRRVYSDVSSRVRAPMHTEVVEEGGRHPG